MFGSRLNSINNNENGISEGMTLALQGFHWAGCSECDVSYLCTEIQCGGHDSHHTHRKAGKPLCKGWQLLDRIDELWNNSIIRQGTFTKNAPYWAQKSVACAREYLKMKESK